MKPLRLSATAAGRYLAATPLREAAAIGAAMLLAYTVLSPWPRYAIGTIGDDGVYVMLGRALARGEGYRNMHLVGQPPHTAYPPGVPLLYAFLWLIGRTLPVVHALIAFLNMVACATTASLLWWLARTRLHARALVAAVFVVGPLLLDASVQFNSLTLSEPWFMLAWATVLVLFDRLRGSDAVLGAGLVGVATALAVAVRLQGIVLLPAILLAMLIERRRPVQLVACLAGALAPIALWTLWRGPEALVTIISTVPHRGWLPPGGPALVTRLALLAAFQNTLGYQDHLAAEVGLLPALGVILTTGWMVLTLAGVIQLVRRHPAIVLTTFASLAVILVWPFHSLRFALVLAPFTGLVIAPGVQLLLDDAPWPRLRQGLRFALLMLATSVVVRQAQIRMTAPDALKDDPRWAPAGHILPLLSRSILETSEWVARNTSPDDRVLAEQTAALYFRSGRRMLESNPPSSIFADFGPAPFAVPGRFLARQLAYQHADVVIIDRSGLAIERDVEVIRAECPHVLERLPDGNYGTHVYPKYYRARQDETCLRPLAERGP